MFDRNDLLENICQSFNKVRWHDAQLIRFEVTPHKDNPTHDVNFDIKLLTNTQSEGHESEEVKLILRDCRLIKLDLDLLGKQLCGNAIAAAWCEKESSLKDAIEHEQLNQFDLPQEERPLMSHLHFRIQLIPPGGEINVFAKYFELNKLTHIE